MHFNTKSTKETWQYYGTYTSTQKRIARTLHALSFKCFSEDEFDNIPLMPDSVNVTSHPPIYSCTFGAGSQFGHLLALANEDGVVTVHNTNGSGPLKTGNVGYQLHNNAIFNVSWVPNCSQLVTVSGDQSGKLSALREDGSLQTMMTFSGHSRSVKASDVNPFDPCVIATGGRDGNILIWDTRCKPHHRADEIMPAHPCSVTTNNKSTPSPGFRKHSYWSQLANNSVTAIIFQDQHTLISAGASDGLIKLWDLRKTYNKAKREPQCQQFHEHSGKSSHRGYTSLSLSPDRHVLYASCMDNKIYSYHLAPPIMTPVAEYCGHSTQTYFVKCTTSPCGKYLLSGSSDNAAYLWLTDCHGAPVGRMTGHFAEVTTVAWSPVNWEKFVTCSDDTKYRIFKIKNVDQDDFDIRLRIRDLTEPCAGLWRSLWKAKSGHSSAISEMSMMPVPLVDIISSNKLELNNTPPATQEGSTSNSCQVLMVTASPAIYTPNKPASKSNHRQGSTRRPTPNTPSTGSRGTLLQWLSAQTPESASTSESNRTRISTTKKEGLKRKLSLMLENQENKETKILYGTKNVSLADNKTEIPTNKCQLLSPAKSNNILCSSSEVNVHERLTLITPPLPSAAKMLSFSSQDRLDSTPQYSSETSLEECSRFLDDLPFTKRVTNKPEYDQYNQGLIQESSNCPCREKNQCYHNILKTNPIMPSLRKTPTNNLPNYVLSGSSPHNRPEQPITKKGHSNWLTSFGYQRKLKVLPSGDKIPSAAFSNVAAVSRNKVLCIRKGKF